jgi:hypothetical protein
MAAACPAAVVSASTKEAAAGNSKQPSDESSATAEAAAHEACIRAYLDQVADHTGYTSQRVFSPCNRDDVKVQAESQEIFDHFLDAMLSGAGLDVDAIKWFFNYLIDRRGLPTPVHVRKWVRVPTAATMALIQMAQLDSTRVSLSKRDSGGFALLDTVCDGTKHFDAAHHAAVVAATDAAALRPEYDSKTNWTHPPPLARAIQYAMFRGLWGLEMFRLLMTRADADGSGIQIDAQVWDAMDDDYNKLQRTVWTYVESFRQRSPLYTEYLPEITAALREAQRKQVEYRTTLAPCVAAAIDPSAPGRHSDVACVALLVAAYLLFY